MTRPDAPYSSFDVCNIVGITYRQLDYWIRIGIVDCTDPAGGSGSRRRFSRADIADIALIEAVRKWVWSPHRAAQLVSDLGPGALRPSGQITIHTEGAVSLVVDVDTLEAEIDQTITMLFPENRVTA